MDADPRQSNRPIPSSVMRPGNMHGLNVYSSVCVRCSQQPTGCSPVQVQWAHVPSCRPVGRAMTVTRSRGSWLVDLDHLPARGAVSFLDVFCKFSGWGFSLREQSSVGLPRFIRVFIPFMHSMGLAAVQPADAV